MCANEIDAKEAFALVDKNSEGKISLKEVPYLLRSLGQNPTENDLDTILGAIDPKKEKKITFEEYLKIQNRPNGWALHGTQEEFVQAFNVFDRDGNGLISGGELRYVLTALGEPLTDRQVDELLRVVEPDKEGMINYEG